MAKIYVVDLTAEEREQLVELTRKGRAGARTIKRAHILLLAGAGQTDQAIVQTWHTSSATVQRTRQKFVEGGLEWALNERSRGGRLPKIDDKIEAVLTTLAQSQPPAGRKRWTLQLLADRLVTLTSLEQISSESIRLVLKKTISNRGSAKSGAFRA